tara:strand:- start:74 stop:289 length:216 start_codon:yes stop_codon:yes gene_type:complete
VTPEETPFDGELQAANILNRCRRIRHQWEDVYRAIGVEFQYREPTADEYIAAIKVVTQEKIKKTRKKPKKD